MALGLIAAGVALTGLNLAKGGLLQRSIPAYADFGTCGQGLRERGDVKLRGVLVGRIGSIRRVVGKCRVELALFPESIGQIPHNAGAQIRAKTVFGEKWVELLYPQRPSEKSLGEHDVIPADRTIDPLEVETILNLSLPLLEAIDPENLAGALEALASGFSGRERAAIRAIDASAGALAPVKDNPRLVRRAIGQLKQSGDVLRRVEGDLFRSLDNLDRLNRFVSSERRLIAANLQKAPALLHELSALFQTRFADLTTIVNKGATVVSLLAARSGDLDRLLDVLPRFNSAWIRNLSYVCEHRQVTDEPTGPRVPGRCWRVHAFNAFSRGGYGTGGRGPERGSAPEEQGDIERILTSPLPEDLVLQDGRP